MFGMLYHLIVFQPRFGGQVFVRQPEAHQCGIQGANRFPVLLGANLFQHHKPMQTDRTRFLGRWAGGVDHFLDVWNEGVQQT